MNATKYTFDTEFRPEGDLISNAARARQKKSYSHDEIDQLCARAREQGLKAGQVRAQEAIAAGALDVVSVLRDVLARTSKEVEQVRADAAGIALIAARKLARAALATLPQSEIGIGNFQWRHHNPAQLWHRQRARVRRARDSVR